MSRAQPASVALFSYGTLQQPNVQLATFGRHLEGSADTLLGYELVPVVITDPHVIAASGLAVHTIARLSRTAAVPIPGVVFSITPAELAAADRYEAGDYQRVTVVLGSGTRAFVYVSGAS
jgi:Gamma-glutamyl cyclotransferase, AIG2-like